MCRNLRGSKPMGLQDRGTARTVVAVGAPETESSKNRVCANLSDSELDRFGERPYDVRLASPYRAALGTGRKVASVMWSESLSANARMASRTNFAPEEPP